MSVIFTWLKYNSRHGYDLAMFDDAFEKGPIDTARRLQIAGETMLERLRRSPTRFRTISDVTTTGVTPSVTLEDTLQRITEELGLAERFPEMN